jgi:hypothetical protein
VLDIVSNLEELRHTGAEFLIVDLETAMTFANLALNSKDQAVIDRNRRNAVKAYHSVSKLASRTHLNEADAKAVSARLGQLKEKLALLGDEAGPPVTTE